jgi:SAM-dependent methyltransferase
MARDWDSHYAAGETPWDRGEPSPALVELIDAGRLPRGRALDIGCGTGTDARYLASRGWEVLAEDVSGLAIERAAAAPKPRGGSIEWRRADFLADDLPAGRFDVVFDRGCFHVFHEPSERSRFAERVARCLGPAGTWVSLLGSTEGGPREQGPPRRNARDVADAVEPFLEIVELRGIEFDLALPERVGAWLLVARQRRAPAVPSTAEDER